jgi:hypothetical protein
MNRFSELLVLVSHALVLLVKLPMFLLKGVEYQSLSFSASPGIDTVLTASLCNVLIGPGLVGPGRVAAVRGRPGCDARSIVAHVGGWVFILESALHFLLRSTRVLWPKDTPRGFLNEVLSQVRLAYGMVQ